MAYYNNGNNTYSSFATDQEALAWAYASSQAASQSQSYSSYSTNSTTGATYSSQGNGGHSAPIQIVLEPAEASNDSGEYSGQDDSDGGRKRACERCRKIKVKCEYPPNVKTCLRCANVGLTCVPVQPKPRSPRPRLSPYDQVMEGVGSSTNRS